MPEPTFSSDQITALTTLINQLFDAQRKAERIEEARSLQRNLRRMGDALQELGLSWHDPSGEPYDETRTDCEASLTGDAQGPLLITETVKPLIRFKKDGYTEILQRAVVIVGGKQ